MEYEPQDNVDSLHPKQLDMVLGEQDPLLRDFEKIMRVIPSNETGHDTFNIHDYPAKFMPQYPRIFIEHFSKSGDLVVDPMCGAGTTLAEACLQSREAYGADIDPVACLISQVAITPLEPDTLESYRKKLYRVLADAFESNQQETIALPSDTDYPNALLWFRPEVLKELLLIRNSILETKAEDKLKNFALICLSSVTRSVSNADPRDIFPERDKEQPVRERKDTLREFQYTFVENMKKVASFSTKVNYEARGQVKMEDARCLSVLDNSADLVFTSPPYCYAIDYARVHQLSTLLFIMSNEQLRGHRRKYIGTDRVPISTRLDSFDGFSFAENEIRQVYNEDRKSGVVLYRYFSDMYQVTRECFRILKPGGHLVYVIGNSTIRKTPFKTAEVLAAICQEAGFRVDRTLERPYYAYRMMRKRNIQSNTIKADLFIVTRKQ
jgi:DNA modification methylase